MATGKKTLTLQQLEQKYSALFLQLAHQNATRNVWQTYQHLPESAQQHPALIEELRQFDHNANVLWPLMHFKSAVRYLQRDPEDIAATGGTNWQKFLPPKNQSIIFFPTLWTETEKKEWGKKAQLDILSSLQHHK